MWAKLILLTMTAVVWRSSIFQSPDPVCSVLPVQTPAGITQKTASVHFDASDNFFLLMKNTNQYIYIQTVPIFEARKCLQHFVVYIQKHSYWKWKKSNITDKQTNNKQTNEIIFTRIINKKHYHNNLSYVTNDAYVFLCVLFCFVLQSRGPWQGSLFLRAFLWRESRYKVLTAPL